jgi:hypothetical protein
MDSKRQFHDMDDGKFKAYGAVYRATVGLLDKTVVSLINKAVFAESRSQDVEPWLHARYYSQDKS